MNYVSDDFKKSHGIDLRKDPMSLQRLQEACEKAKKELSSVPETDLNLPFITADASGQKHLQMKISRAEVRRAGRQLDRALPQASVASSGRCQTEAKRH
ncbi:MAG: Hsp70 family protein [Pirellulales bacterium]